LWFTGASSRIDTLGVAAMITGLQDARRRDPLFPPEANAVYTAGVA